MNYLDRFKKKKILEKQNFIKIHPVGAELFHTEGRTDMTKLTVAFRNFAKAPKSMYTAKMFPLCNSSPEKLQFLKFLFMLACL